MPRDLHLGSLGPSTVTFIALWYVATCGGSVATVIMRVSILPAGKTYNAHKTSKTTDEVSLHTHTRP